MPKRARQEPEQFTKVKHFRSAEEISTAIEKLKRRLAEVEALKGLRYGDQRIKNAANNIRAAILEIFDANSPEYGEHRDHEIFHEGPESWQIEGAQGLQYCFEAGVPQSIKLLEGLTVRLQEKLGDLRCDAGARVRSAFEAMDLHPRIAGASSDLYRDGHHKQGVLEASIVLVNYVREKSRQHSLDGSKLMTMVFSANNPIIAFLI